MPVAGRSCVTALLFIYYRSLPSFKEFFHLIHDEADQVGKVFVGVAMHYVFTYLHLNDISAMHSLVSHYACRRYFLKEHRHALAIFLADALNAQGDGISVGESVLIERPPIGPEAEIISEIFVGILRTCLQIQRLAGRITRSILWYVFIVTCLLLRCTFSTIVFYRNILSVDRYHHDQLTAMSLGISPNLFGSR